MAATAHAQPSLMITLDPRTIIAIASLMNGLMAVVLFLMRKNYPAHIRGLGNWASAPALWLAATLLFANRHAPLPALVLTLLPNMLLLLGSVVFLAGCQRFLGQPVRWRWWLGFLALTALALGWFTLAQADYAMRLMIFTLATAIIYGATLHVLLRHGDRRLPTRVVETTLALHLIIIVLRLGASMLGMGNGNLYDTSLVQLLYLTGFVIATLFYTVGAVLMATDRLVTELDYLATHDPLTQVLNRRALLALCTDELARSERNSRGPALAMLDLDHFKAINDTHGHQHGDAVLRHFATSVQGALRSTDRLGRYGGEEFILLLPETGCDDATAVADRIHAATTSGHALDCPFSMGLTTWRGKGDTLDAMLSRADAALYQAKAQGRNRTCIA